MDSTSHKVDNVSKVTTPNMKCHMVFYVTKVCFLMILLINKFMNVVIHFTFSSCNYSMLYILIFL